MEQNQDLGNQYPGEEEAKRALFLQIWKERIYRFFYNIWPGVMSLFTGIIYFLFRVIRGGVRIAMEQFQPK